MGLLEISSVIGIVLASALTGAAIGRISKGTGNPQQNALLVSLGALIGMGLLSLLGLW